jgi:hypothetical protein
MPIRDHNSHDRRHVGGPQRLLMSVIKLRFRRCTTSTPPHSAEIRSTSAGVLGRETRSSYEPYMGSAPIFLGTISPVVQIGELITRVFGREIVGQLKTVTEQADDIRLVA